MGHKSAKLKLRVDVQCGLCGSLTHQAPEASSKGSPAPAERNASLRPAPERLPKFCPCCGAGMERFCLRCQKKADMFFEEWWPEDDECLRTYSPAKRCPSCNAILEPEGHGHCEGGHLYPN